MKKTLLEQAKLKSTGKVNVITDEEIDVYLAILKQEISPNQAKQVLYSDKSDSGGSLYARSLVVLREAFGKGRIKIV